jgi:hypothetical protein
LLDFERKHDSLCFAGINILNLVQNLVKEKFQVPSEGYKIAPKERGREII